MTSPEHVSSVSGDAGCVADAVGGDESVTGDTMSSRAVGTDDSVYHSSSQTSSMNPVSKWSVLSGL